MPASSRCVSAPAPLSSVQLCHGAPASISTTAPPLCSRSATAPRPAASCSVASPSQQQLSHHGASASNKPHPAKKSTPVWLAIWHIWAGFANSQLRCAIFQSNYSCKCPSPLLPPWSCCSDRRKSFGPSAPIAYASSVSPPNEAVAWPWAQFQQITAHTNPCSRHLWGTLACAVASICAHRARL